MWEATNNHIFKYVPLNFGPVILKKLWLSCLNGIDVNKLI